MTNLANGRRRILIHLETNKKSQEIKDHGRVPYELCQKGIAKSVNLSRARVSQIIKYMLQKGLIKEDIHRVVGLKRRRKVYSLTPKGLERAREIRKQLENEKVILKKDSSEHEVELGKIDSYIDSQNPLLLALNNINDERVINLTQKEIQKKEDVFVGRKDEIEFLLKKLNHLKNNNSLAILIKGKAGIGKTRLVNEFKHKAIPAGFEFLMGKGHYDSSEPYLPFKEAFEFYQEKDENKVYPLKFIERVDEEGGRITLEDEEIQKRRRDLIFSKTVKNLRKLAERKPMIIFIDDLQWTDKATCMLFHYLSDKLNDVPVLLIGALRLENLSDNDFLYEVLQRMRRKYLFDELKLGPLKWKDTKEIAQGLTGEVDMPDEFVQLIQDISEGNPLFSKEIIKEMLEDGIIDPKNNKFPTKKGDIEVPEVVGDIIESRVRKLDRVDFQVLQTCSIIGEEIRFSLLQSVTNIDSFDLLESVDILTGTGILEENPEEDRLYFSHGLIRKYVYENIPNSLRKTIHGQVDKSMEKEFEEKIEKYYSYIGFHYKRADEFDKAFEFYRKAGKKARSLYAHEDAVEMYKEALDLIEKGDLNEKKRWKILEKLGDVNKIIGNYDVSLEDYEKIPKEKIEPKYKQRIYRKMASVYERKGEFDKALEVVEEGLAEKDGKNIEIARLLYRKGLIETSQGMYNLAEKNFLKAHRIYEHVGGDKEIADIHMGLGIIYDNKGKYGDSLDHLKKALGKFEKIEDFEGEASTLNNLGNVFLNRGDLEKALEYFKPSLKMRKKVGDKKEIASTLNNVGIVYLRMGELEKTIKYYQESHEIWGEIGDQQGIAGCLVNIGDYYQKKGELDIALENLKYSLNICEEIDFKIGEVTCLINLGSVYLLKNEINRAERYFKKSLDINQNYDYRNPLIYTLNGLSKTYIQKNELENALEKGKKALDISKKIGTELEMGISYCTLGRVYKEREEWTKAKEEFEAGKKTLKDAGKKSELAELLYYYALFWKDKGKDKKSREYMEEAHSMFKDIGMKLWIEKCEEELK